MSHQSTTESVDYIVIGAGAGGLSAALFAAIDGHSAVVLERSSLIGGTSAYTAGTLWVPETLEAKKRGIVDDATQAQRYVSEVSHIDDRDAKRLRRYLEVGPEAVATIEGASEVSFEVRENHPDYFSDREGSSTGNRALEARTYTNMSSKLLKRVRPQQKELTVFGGMALDRHDIQKLSNIARSPLSFAAIRNYFHAGLLVSRHLFSRVFLGRPSRFTMGNALIARLVVSLEKRNVPILTDIDVTDIQTVGGKVRTVTYTDSSGKTTKLTANTAVIVASGGFNRNETYREQVLGKRPRQWSALSPNSSGNLYDCLTQLGAQFERGRDKSAFWAPISLPPRKNGEVGSYPHFIMDRGKPGFIVVDQNGKRYQNEAMSYNHFSQQMIAHGSDAQPSFLIADHNAVKEYGIGVIRPGGWGKRFRMRDGYLSRSSTLEGLAKKIDVPAQEFSETVERFNAFALNGVDEDFGRGSSTYEQNLGDPSLKNPNLGPLKTAPFYAIRLYPGEIGASAGFLTDDSATALDSEGQRIEGLYIIGNDMSSVFGENYPGPGITLGPALVFAYAAVHDAAKQQ